MKIKHFAGYGSVTAQKVSEKKVMGEYGEALTEIKIRVRGNHERGLEIGTWDVYGAAGWLLSKFKKGFDYNSILRFTTNDGYERVGNIDEEVCEYTFYIR